MAEQPVVLHFDTLNSTLDAHVQRARVPGGWIVVIASELTTVLPDRTTFREYVHPSFFYPDPFHQWGGGSLPASEGGES
jgi:hypothetical protein